MSSSASLRSRLGSAIYWLGLAVSTLLFAAACLLTWVLPFEARYRFITQWTRFNLWSLRCLCGISYRVEGRAHLPQGAAIVLSKHQSAWETLAFQSIFPAPIAWVLKRELLWVPFFGWGLMQLTPIAIDRTSGRRAVQQVLEQGQQRLAAGRWVVVFPEGTRVAPGQRRRYGISGALLAEKSACPVVPVAHNAGRYWPRRGFVKHPGEIRVVIGPPIAPQGDAAATLAAAENWIEATQLRLDRA